MIYSKFICENNKLFLFDPFFLPRWFFNDQNLTKIIYSNRLISGLTHNRLSLLQDRLTRFVRKVYPGFSSFSCSVFNSFLAQFTSRFIVHFTTFRFSSIDVLLCISTNSKFDMIPCKCIFCHLRNCRRLFTVPGNQTSGPKLQSRATELLKPN